jgi:PKD repeat protein
MKKKAKKKMVIRKVLSCFILIAILMSVVPVSIAETVPNARSNTPVETADIYPACSERPMPAGGEITKATIEASLAPGYCPSSGGSREYEYISSVTYTINPGGTMTITVDIFIANPSGCTYGEPCPEYDESPEYINVWIDWNGDKDFSDPGEKVIDVALTGYLGINYRGTMTSSKIVTIPQNTVNFTWTRVNLGWGHDPNNPCEYSWEWGDVVDKEVMVRPELEIRGGLSQYKDELKDKVFRRKDDKPRFEVKALPQSGEKVEVDVFRKGNTPIKTIEAKKKSGKIYEAIWADWKSSEWTNIPDKIPVGEYKAKAKITKSGTELTSSDKKEFYVIFDDGINGHYVEGKEGHNYYGGNEHPEPTPDLGNLIVYSLHIYNSKIFSVAIDRVDGQNSPMAAANLLRSKVTDIIAYSTPNPTRSTLFYDGTLSGQLGQCMDYANLLSAYLRTVGIPSRPITTTDVDGWNFHCWTEGWLPEVGSSKPNDKWSVLDSTDGYESDTVIPHNYWIAHTPDSDSNELPPWHSRVYTHPSATDVRYVHYEVDPPEPTHNSSIEIYPTTDKLNYTIGENVNINVEFKNTGATDNTTTYNVAVTQHIEKYRGVSVRDGPTYVLYETGSITVPAGGSVNLSYTLSPSEYETNGHYIVKAWINETCMGFAEFDVYGGLNISISAPSAVNINEEFDVSLMVENILDKSVNNITVDAYFPPDSDVFGPTNFTIQTLSSGELNITTWSVNISESEIHNIGFVVFSNDTGFNRLYTAIDVLAPPELDVEDEYVPFFGEFGKPFGIGFRVKNIGDLNATNVSVEIFPPENVTATNTTWNIDNLIGGENVTCYTDITFTKPEDFIIDVFASDDAGHNASGVIYVDVISNLSASFNDMYSDYGLDTNSDGMYNYLVIEVGVNVASAGIGNIEGWLCDSNGTEIVKAENSSYLSIENHSIILKFVGFDIYKHGVNGPYDLRDLKLFNESGALIDTRDFAYTTSAHNYTDFQHLVTLTGFYSDYGTDIDGDGLIDNLTVDVGVILASEGHCVINARLVDKNEEEIVWASNTSWLSANQSQIIQLNFDGLSINKHGVDGPYHLKDVYIYHTGDPTQPDYAYDACTTSVYNYTDFESILSTDLPNVELISADSMVTSINVTSLNLSEINETYKPEGVVSQSAYMINSTGAGNFTLRFTDIQNANMITAYKIDPLSIPPNKWIELDTTTTATNVTFTMSVGDLPVVFAVNVTVKVAFDETHNEIFSIDPNAKYSYSKFASLLEDRGYEVKTLNSSQITSEKLNNYSIFVIPAPTKPFDANEITAIREFVSTGGNLLLINEWGGDFRQGSNLNDLSKSFGISFNNDTVNDPTNNFHNTPSYVLIHEFRGHYITKDINEFLYPAGCSLVATNSIAWADDDSYTTLPNIPLVKSKAEKELGNIAVLAATNFERGRVVCIGDGDFCDDLDVDGNGRANIEGYDNKKLALNIMEWLSRGAINEPPVASFSYSPENPVVNQTITFNASSSYDPDGTIENYEWDFGDGTNGGGEIVNYSYCAAGNYTVNLIVTDDNGAYNTSMKIINVAICDQLIWNITSDKEEYPPGDHVLITMKLKNEGEETVLITNPITTTFIASDGSIVLEEDLSSSISVTLGAGGQWSFGTSYKLPDDAPEGYYDVRVSISGGNYVKTVEDLFHVSYPI